MPGDKNLPGTTDPIEEQPEEVAIPNHPPENVAPSAPVTPESAPTSTAVPDELVHEVKQLGTNNETTVVTLGVLKMFRPETDEEQQTALAEAASMALTPFDRGANIDEKSLVARDAVDYSNKKMRSGNFPTGRYKSTVGYYGYEVQHQLDKDDKPLKTTYSQSKFGQMLLGLEKWMYRLRDSMGITGRGLRTKLTGPGFEQAIMDHAKRLGQDEYYSIGGDGSLQEDTENLKNGAVLDDILRLQGRTEPEYKFIQELKPQIDEILARSTQEVARIHQTADRGIGEVLCNDLIIQIESQEKAHKVKGVRLALPDVKYREDADVLEQKATDLADLCFSVGSAALQTGNLALARHYLEIVLAGYPDSLVKSALLAIIPTRPRYGYFSNRPRLGFDRIEKPRESFESIREIVMELLKKPVPALPAGNSSEKGE